LYFLIVHSVIKIYYIISKSVVQECFGVHKCFAMLPERPLSSLQRLVLSKCSPFGVFLLLNIG